jgi:hypothetical protein
MNLLRQILRELAGLFVDDGLLALMVLATIIIATFAAAVAPALGGVLLLAGCFLALLTSVLRAVRR